ncbi:hypothetical protein [Paracoccus fistulariae]|uniref:Uncharacterized protein n=1 Tax=Paracoccus fistulariae TaxID=658446 RepID=A0ABY7SJM5_9RHOB|nr:hypothetical protein [Paracoccus fistulariae]MDB6182019.1 hypothetical protein [Paracoccus fistulariae]WCR06747.1 hypothetical protein JHX87_14890 [Paracoccus fistulariae]
MPPEPPNLVIVAQAGRLEYEAIIFAASLRHAAPGWQGGLYVAEPQPDGAWAGHDTRLSAEGRAILERLDARILPFTARHFGASYPYGNKIEALLALPTGQPFIFFDTDTLITGPLDQVAFDLSRPSASMRREGTWPDPPLYGPDYSQIWASLYDRFGLDFASSLDRSQPDEHWERYLYFNAGWFFGADPAEFGQRFLNWALEVQRDPQDELACQSLDPWLDQVILPLVIHSLGGGRPGPELAGLDGDITCHYRNLSLLYARESDAALEVLEAAVAPNWIKKHLRNHDPAKKLIYQGKGRDKLRPMFDRSALPTKEQPIRQRLKKRGWWLV